MKDQASLKNSKRLYSLDEAAEALGLSPWTLRAHKKKGSLPTVSAGRRVLVSSETIDLISRQGLPSLRSSRAKRRG
jgi:excisionase family DNA binding protein